MKQSGKVALGGVMGALSLAFMLMSFFPYMTYALPAIAGAVLIPLVIEAGVGTGWMVYGAVALLSAIIAPDLEAKILFILFFGYYPILKSLLERLRKRWLEWLLKIGLFNASMIGSYFLLLFVFHLDADEFVLGGINLTYVFLLAGNVTFFIYDFALTLMIGAYMRKLHPRIIRIIPRNWR